MRGAALAAAAAVLPAIAVPAVAAPYCATTAELAAPGSVGAPAPVAVRVLQPLCVSIGWLPAGAAAPAATARLPDGAQQRIVPFVYRNGAGRATWQLRFTARQEGDVVVRLGEGRGSSVLVLNAVAAAPASAGFVQVGLNRRHFVDSSTGDTFFPVGFNVAWPPNHQNVSAAEFYDDYFVRMSAAGANYARVWLGPTLVPPWNPLVVLRGPNCTVDHAAAAEFDGVLAAAERRGIKLLVALDSFNTLCPDAVNSECRWSQSVYNRRNGGPLAPAAGFLEFWSDPAVAAAWGEYMAYAVARWGASPSVLAWQLFNEVDAAMFDVVPAAYGWHRTMAAQLRAGDAYGHIISESFGIAAGNPEIDAMAGFDITTTHSYARVDRLASPDVGMWGASWTAGKAAAYRKPSFVGEFGCNDDAGQPLSRAALHDGVWAPIFAGGAASGMFWYWDTIPESWWAPEFRALRSFLSRVPVARGLAGYDWAELTPSRLAPGAAAVAVRGAALGGGDAAALLLWLHSRNASDPCARPGGDVEVPSFELDLPAGEGVWAVEWVDTATGATLAAANVTAAGGGAAAALRIPTPLLRRDAALVAVRG